MFDWETLIAAIVALLGGGGIVKLLQVRADKRKINIESDILESETILNRWKELEARADGRSYELEERTNELSKKVDELTKEIYILREELSNFKIMYQSLNEYAGKLERIIMTLDHGYSLPQRPKILSKKSSSKST